MQDRIVIRPMRDADRAMIWSILKPIIQAGNTYAIPLECTQNEALDLWTGDGHETFVAEYDRRVAGTYFLKPNQRGGGAHVANCAYATAQDFTGRGIANAMCQHSLALAHGRGFKAMQFNFVISTNARAVALWRRNGFEVVGRVPDAFIPPSGIATEVYVMYRKL